jgi:multidrug efflux system membrane fusion protein
MSVQFPAWSRRRLAIAAVAVIAAGALGVHWLYLPVTAATPEKQHTPATVPVVAGTAVARDVPIYLTGLGSAQGMNTVTVRPRIDGELIDVLFTEGQMVKAGDVIARIDSRQLEAQLSQARASKAKDEAQLANAKRDLARSTNLAAKGYETRQTTDTQKAMVDQLTAAVEGDQAAIDNATVQLSYTTIASPITGRTGMRQVDAGNMVHANDSNGLVVITQVQPISVVFTLPQDALDQVIEAMGKGTVKIFAFKRDDVTPQGQGTLALVDNQIDQSAGTIRLKATFPNTDNALWPGQFVNIRLLVAERQDAVTVPAQVVQRGPNGTFVYVIKPDDTVEARTVKVGPVRDGIAVIDEGLAAGERVVVDGQYKIQPGSRVDAREAPEPVARRS